MRRGLCQRPARFQASDSGQEPNVAKIQKAWSAPHQRFSAQRNSCIEATTHFNSEKARGRYADHRKRMAFKPKRPSQCGWISAKLALPECVADHRTRSRAATLIVRGRKQAASYRRNAEYIKKLRAY